MKVRNDKKAEKFIRRYLIAMFVLFNIAMMVIDRVVDDHFFLALAVLVMAGAVEVILFVKCCYLANLPKYRRG